MNIPGKEVAYRKAIGKQGAKTLFQTGLIGGLHVVSADNEILGMASEPLLARFIAKKNHKGLEFDELTKSETATITMADFGDSYDFWAGETERARAVYFSR